MNRSPSTLERGKPTWHSTAWVKAMSSPLGGSVPIKALASISLESRRVSGPFLGLAEIVAGIGFSALAVRALFFAGRASVGGGTS